jgi:hypothetical protein
MKVHQEQDYLRLHKNRQSRLQKHQKLTEEKDLLTRMERTKQLLLEKDSLDPTHLYSSDLSYQREEWMDLPHRYNLYRIITESVYALELISKHSDVLLSGLGSQSHSNCFLLDHQVTRIGTHSSCECSIELKGDLQRKGMISKIHCLLYHNSPDKKNKSKNSRMMKKNIRNHNNQNDEEDNQDNYDEDEVEEEEDEKDQFQGDLTIVDNNSLYGSYVVTAEGAIKVPSKVSKGLTIQNGSLLCIGK